MLHRLILLRRLPLSPLLLRLLLPSHALYCSYDAGRYSRRRQEARHEIQEDDDASTKATTMTKRRIRILMTILSTNERILDHEDYDETTLMTQSTTRLSLAQAG